MKTPLRFEGVAHPPPGKTRVMRDDLTRAEIDTANLGRRGSARLSTPVNVEHDGPDVGRVIGSCLAPSGQMRVSGTIHDEAIAKEIRAGRLLGLSLGTRMDILGSQNNQRVVGRHLDHLAVCEVPRRTGCYIDEVDGKRLPHRIDVASGSSRTPPHTPHSTHPPPSLQHPCAFSMAKRPLTSRAETGERAGRDREERITTYLANPKYKREDI